MDFEVVAEGLQFPEGPIAMPDGSIVLVEIARGTLTRVWNGRTEVIADLGGGPNGAALGPDGAVYVCNNGGLEWRVANGLRVPVRAAADYTTGRIERVDLATGRFERLYESFDGERLGGPNDIVFDRSGGFWFTDLGKSFARQRDHSSLYYARPDGSHLRSRRSSRYFAQWRRAVAGRKSRLLQRHGHAEAVGIRRCRTRQARAARRVRAARPRRLHAARPPMARQSGSGGERQRLLGDALQRRHHDLRAGRLVRARRIPGSDDHEHLFRRRGYARCVHHAVGHGKLVKARWPRPGLKLNFS